MEFEWDEAKNLANIRRHRIDFADVYTMFERPMLIRIDSRMDYGEERLIGTGFLSDGIAVVVWVEQIDSKIRIISARKANRYEQKQFAEHLKN